MNMTFVFLSVIIPIIMEKLERYPFMQVSYGISYFERSGVFFIKNAQRTRRNLQVHKLYC